MIFVLKNVYYVFNQDNNMIFKSSPMTNYKDLIQLETSYDSNNKQYYQSSVYLTNKHVEIRLNLKDDINIDLTSVLKTSLNLNIEIVDFDALKNKYIYKISKIEISDDNNDIIEDEQDKLLDFYEIKNIYDSLERDIYEKINNKKKKILEFENMLSTLKISLDNIDHMDNIKRNIEKYL